MNINTAEWPLLGVSNMVQALAFYLANLNFEKDQEIGSEMVSLRLGRFILILTSECKGPFYAQSTHILKSPQKILSPAIPSLWIPVEEPASYYKRIAKPNITVVTSNKLMDYDFEGFYILDNESNKILFFRDYHGHYNPTDWVWSWNDYLENNDRKAI